MMIELGEAVRALLRDRDTVKVLATVDSGGKPHVTRKDSIRLDAKGNLEYDELIESSQTNKNLVYSIWFHKQAAVNILGTDKSSYQIKGTPLKALIAGRKFEERYKEVKEEQGAELSTLWIIEPEELIEETLAVRRTEETERHPLLRHLDTLLDENYIGGKD
jgi:hypothetical protein